MDHNELIRRLTVLDSKCSALLQLAAVVLALTMIPASIGKLDGLREVLSIIIAFLFLLTSFLSLSVIWVNWEPSERTLGHRTFSYQVAIVIAAIGLICMAILTVSLINAK